MAHISTLFFFFPCLRNNLFQLLYDVQAIKETLGQEWLMGSRRVEPYITRSGVLAPSFSFVFLPLLISFISILLLYHSSSSLPFVCPGKRERERDQAVLVTIQFLCVIISLSRIRFFPPTPRASSSALDTPADIVPLT